MTSSTVYIRNVSTYGFYATLLLWSIGLLHGYCPRGWITHGRKCYGAFMPDLTLSVKVKGAVNCQLHGGRLMSPKTKEENDVASKLLLSRSPLYSTYAIIGVNARGTEARFRWRDGTNVSNTWSNWQNGREWMSNLKRRRHIACRVPEPTSLARATAFYKQTVMEFFQNLSSVMDRYHFTPDAMYNTDETGITTVQKPAGVLAEVGKKQVGSITSRERGELVTVLCTISAAGNTVPPLLIFPRVRYRDNFVSGVPVGSIGCATKSGWINEEKFIFYMEHLINQTRCSMEKPILLILDNHEAHISLGAVQMAKDHGVIMLTLPPHTSHRLQPLDVGVYCPLKAYYNKALDGWIRSHPGKTASIYDLPGIFDGAYQSATSQSNILGAFRKTGIYPYNEDIFPDSEFMSASVTDRPDPDHPQSDVTPTQESELPSNDPLPSSSKTGFPVEVENQGSSVSSTSDDVEHGSPGNQSHNITQSPGYVSPSDLIPFPIASPRKSKVKRKRGRTTILTDTPEKEQIEQAFLERQKKQSKSSKGDKQKRNKPKRSEVLLMDDPLSSENGSEVSSVEHDSEDDHSKGTEDESDRPSTISEGEYILVKFTGKSVIHHYIGKIETIEGDNVEAQFMRKKRSCMEYNKPTFVFKDSDVCLISKEDIICKLPMPFTLGGTAPTKEQFIFPCDLDAWDVE